MKRTMRIILALVLLISCVPAWAFASEEPVLPVSPVPVEETAAYTLSDLTQLMTTTGTAFENAQINRLSDEAASKGYMENVKSLEMLELAGSLGISTGVSFDSISLDLAKSMKNYFKEHLDDNYEADMNSIRETALSTFYSMYQVQEYKEVAKESLAIEEETLKTVEKKFKLGSASRLDYLQAQMDVQSAKASLASAEANCSKALMGFNLSMNNPLLKEIKFKDEGSAIDKSVLENGVEEAVCLAVKNRNEISQMHFLFSVTEKNWKHARLINRQGTSAYMSAQASYETMAMADSLIEKQIEMEIRSLFDDIAAKKLALETAETTAALAEEAYHISSVSYSLGASTLTDLRTAANSLSGAKLGLVSARSDYEQAICSLNYAVGVGTSRITLNE